MDITKTIFSIILLVAGFHFLGTVAAAQNSTSSVRSRIIRAEKPSLTDDDGVRPAIEVVQVSIGNSAVALNSVFSTDNSWLRDLKVRVKNISGKRLNCVGVSFGLLAEIDTKLRSDESWPWVLGFYRGNCRVNGETADKTNFRLEPGKEVVLGYRDIPQLFRGPMDMMGGLGKAVFHRHALVGFKKKHPIETPLAFTSDTVFIDTDPY